MRKLPKADRLSWPEARPDEWAMSASLEPLDRVAVEHEARWGVGVLDRLVAPATAARFASARKRLDDAIESGDWQETARRADVLIRGWKALDEEARAAGHTPEPDRFWTAQSDTGRKFVFVQHERDAHAAAKKFPDHVAWSMAEVMRVLEARTDTLLNAADMAKTLWPGSTVEKRERAPLRLDEEVPF